MKKLLGRLRGLWAREPVLVGTVAPILVSLGIVTQTQVSAVTKAIAGAVAVAAQLGGAFHARSKVKPKDPPAA